MENSNTEHINDQQIESDTISYHIYSDNIEQSSTSLSGKKEKINKPFSNESIYKIKLSNENHNNILKDLSVFNNQKIYKLINPNVIYDIKYKWINDNDDFKILFFNDLFEKVLDNPKKIQDFEIYDIGLFLVLNTKKIEQKEEIFNKLLILYPSKFELYNYLGNIFISINDYKSLLWFIICYQINPSYNENILDLITLLLKINKKNKEFVCYLIQNNKDIQNIEDERIKKILDYIQKDSKNIININNEIKNMNDILKNIEQYDTDGKYFIYNNLAELYCEASNIKESIIYLNKTIENGSKILNKELIVFAAYNSFLIKCDYIYTDNKYRNQINKLISNFYKNENDFSFHLDRIKEKNNVYVKKINIGYLSNSIFSHAVSNFIFPILEYHNKDIFNITIFTDLNQSNSNKDNLKLYIKLFEDMGVKIIDISDKNMFEAANIINNNNIDILIELDGYTKNNRLEILSKNPAPIQINYLGYPNSTGLDFIKYRIVDHITDPDNSTQIYSETKLYMPKCFLIYKSILQTNPIIPRTLKKDDFIIIGSINKEIKLSDELIDTWKQIMNSTTNTKLLIKLEKDNVLERLNYYKNILCISEDRLIIKPSCSKEEYISIFEEVDLFLDTFPYSGTTTTCNILYNSIPLITLYNKDYHAHCVSASLLINSGLGELVAYSIEEYIKKTITLCNSYEKINKYKSNIRNQFMKLMDPEDFISNYEDLLLNTIKEYYNQK